MEQLQQQLNIVAQQVQQQQQLMSEQQAQFGQLQQQLLAALARATQAETERTQALNLSAAAQQAAATAVTAAAAAILFIQQPANPCRHRSPRTIPTSQTTRHSTKLARVETQNFHVC